MCRVLLCENDLTNKLLGTDVSVAFSSTLLPQTDHEVEHRVTTKHLVTHVGAHHDGGLIIEDGGGVPRPNCQSKNKTKKPW